MHRLVSPACAVIFFDADALVPPDVAQAASEATATSATASRSACTRYSGRAGESCLMPYRSGARGPLALAMVVNGPLPPDGRTLYAYSERRDGGTASA